MNFPELLAEAVEQGRYYMTIPGVIEEYEALDNVELIQDEIQDTGRWSIYKRAVYKHDNRYWAVEYDEPATENQEIDNHEYSVYEVLPVTKTIVDYARVSEVGLKENESTQDYMIRLGW